VLIALGAAGLLLVAGALVRAWEFSPGEQLEAPICEDIAVSAQDSLYPPSDALRFDEPPEAVYVYLVVEGMPSGQNLKTEVERSGSGSVFTRIFSGEDRIVVLDEQEERLSPDGEGISGVIKFAIRAESGGKVPPGNYTVGIHVAGEPGDVLARKRFTVAG
jgi:hypothetical protein